MTSQLFYVLLVEDAPSDARLIREWLSSAPDIQTYIKVTDTLHEALVLIAETRFDIILLDLSLPDSFGMETLKQVHAAAPHSAIIVLTGFDDRTLGVTAVQNGAQDYLIKGDTDAKILVRAIHYAVERHHIEHNLQQQHQFAEALREIAGLLTSTLELEEVLDRILVNIGRVIPHDFVNILLLEGSQVQVVRSQQEAIPEQETLNPEASFTLEGQPLLAKMAQTQTPLLIPDLKTAELPNYTDKLSGVRAFAGVPIRKSGETIGFITVFSLIPSFFTSGDVDRLSAFAEQAAIALQNAQLYRQTLDLVAFEERQRLARELHDSVSQTLFTCTVMAESVLRRWNSDPPKAHSLMQDVYRLARSALAEMRVLLLELRPETLTKVGLPQLFEQLILSLRSRSSVIIHLEVNKVPALPDTVQITLYRILQESLNNIVKHAQAQQVWIQLNYVANQLSLTIKDDGRGFDPQRVAATSLGLEIMRERAEAIQARLSVESQTGQGTLISLLWSGKEKTGV